MAKKQKTIQHADVVGRFASRLRELRHSRGLTQSELGKAAKVTTSYVGRLEAGNVAPGIDLVEKLAIALGATIADLVPNEKEPDTEQLLRDRATELFKSLMASADRETLRMLCPLLARLGESPTRRR